MYVSIYARIYVYMHVCMYVCMYVSVTNARMSRLGMHFYYDGDGASRRLTTRGKRERTHRLE